MQNKDFFDLTMDSKPKATWEEKLRLVNQPEKKMYEYSTQKR